MKIKIYITKSALSTIILKSIILLSAFLKESCECLKKDHLKENSQENILISRSAASE